MNKPAMPLKAYTEFSAFKIYLLDVGLLGALSELDAATLLEGNSIFVEFKGALTEQYVLQQIVSDTIYKPYYYAGENLRAQSLRFYHEKFQPAQAIRTSMIDYREQEWLINLPLYAICNL